MLRRSIINIVVRRVLLMTFLYIAVTSILVYTQMDETMALLRQKTLTEHAYDIASYIEREDGHLILDMPQEHRDFYSKAGRFYQFVVREESGYVLFHSPVAYLRNFPTDWPQDGDVGAIDFMGPYNTHFMGVSVVYETGGAKYLVQVAQSEDAVKAYSDFLASIFLKKISIIGVPFLLLLIPVIILSVRQGLSPLRRLSQQAGKISFSSPGVRLTGTRLPDELTPLVEAVNGALDRLESGIEKQREFTANAAHELRTPLSILRSHVDLLEDRAVAARLRSDVNAMSRLVSQLLEAARLDHPERFPRRRMDLVSVVKDVCTACWPSMIAQGRQLEVTGIETPVPIDGHYDSIQRALRNILDNALAYTPKGSPIAIDIQKTEVRIADRGPGIPDEDKGRVFEKFWRKHASNGEGSGLGMSIVRRTMELHGGTVRVEDNPGGGAVFILSFPAPPEDII